MKENKMEISSTIFLKKTRRNLLLNHEIDVLIPPKYVEIYQCVYGELSYPFQSNKTNLIAFSNEFNHIEICEDFLRIENAEDGYYLHNFLTGKIKFMGDDWDKVSNELDGKYIDLEEVYCDAPPKEDKLAQKINDYKKRLERSETLAISIS